MAKTKRTRSRYGAPLDEKLAYWTDRTGECWKWLGASNSDGYGQLRWAGRSQYAHRLAYELDYGPIPDGSIIDHVCRNRMCVRPKHLILSTDKLNAENRSTTGHGASGVRGVHRTRDGKWEVRVRHNYRRYSGGTFANLDEATEAASALRNLLFTNNFADRE